MIYNEMKGKKILYLLYASFKLISQKNTSFW